MMRNGGTATYHRPKPSKASLKNVHAIHFVNNSIHSSGRQNLAATRMISCNARAKYCDMIACAARACLPRKIVSPHRQLYEGRGDCESDAGNSGREANVRFTGNRPVNEVLHGLH